MPDAGAAPSIALLQTILTVAGVVLAPAIGVVAGLLSRPGIQRRQQEAEYKLKRLELIEKSITVGKSLSNSLNASVDISLVTAEYTKVVNSLSEPVPPSAADRMLSFEQHRLPLRLFLVDPT